LFPKHSRKRLGQHFLKDSTVIATIIQNLALKANDTVVEIGPGRGALTYSLLKILPKLTVIELDKAIITAWSNQDISNLAIINADALKVDYSKFGANVRLVGNLPYNISTPILIYLLDYLPYIQDMHFMLQKEVVDRICASPSTKDYGRLSVIIQAFCEATSIMEVAPSSFTPAPKVNSAVVRLIPHNKGVKNKAMLEKLLAISFAMRRKTLFNNFKGKIPLEILEKCKLDLKMRPENITVEEYIKLANML